MTLLEQDHQKVKKLMGEIEKTTERGVKTRMDVVPLEERTGAYV